MYKFKKDKEKFKIPKYEFLKSHSDNNFEEPIFSFVPSIGISEIEKISNDFSEYWTGPKMKFPNFNKLLLPGINIQDIINIFTIVIISNQVKS